MKYRAAKVTIALLAVSGCRHATDPGGQTGAEAVTLRPGQPVVARNAGYTLTLIRVDNDSRCPVQVACFSAGDATVVFTAGPNIPGIGQTLAMQFVHTNAEPRSVVLSGYLFSLDSLAPRPVAGQTIAQSDYVAYFTVKFLPD